jgi:mRNA interferase MazF
MKAYIPRQSDVLWLDFNPTKGREIQKRRPALVLSTNAFNRTTGFIVACPITSTIRNLPQYYTLPEGMKTKGQVITSQFRTLDITSAGGRNPEYIEKLPIKNFVTVAQMVEQVFDFQALLQLS